MSNEMMAETAAVTAIEKLYRDQGRRLWWALLAYAGDPDVASDAAAEAFAQALRRGAELRDPRAWVWQVAFRIAAGELQHRRATDHVIPDTAATRDDSDSSVEILEALSRLNTRQRAAIVLHYYGDRPVKEIASLLGISSATVRVHLHRGRQRLSQLLEEDDV
jgi:RNA polymerase sigma-70 factor (ECF subfamily)